MQRATPHPAFGHLPQRSRGRRTRGRGRCVNLVDAKRGRGTMRSMVEGATENR